MADSSRFLFIASMDVTPEKEDLFNEVYDEEHVPALLGVPGVLEVARYRSRDFDMAIGGEVVHRAAGSPRYHAIYRVSEPGVVASSGWAQAVERGRWPLQVRPATSSRQHSMLELIEPAGR
jgi:hypothetical protein